MMERIKVRSHKAWVQTIILLIFACLSIYPLLYLTCYSLKTNDEIFYSNPFGLPLLTKSSDHKITPRRTAFVFFILPPQMSRCCSSDAQFLNTANSNLHLFYCMRDKKDLLQEFHFICII